MSDCKCFSCSCKRLLEENKISNEVYDALLAGYFYGQTKIYESCLDTFNKFNIKSTSISDENTIGGHVACIEYNCGECQWLLEEVVSDNEVLKQLIKESTH